MKKISVIIPCYNAVKWLPKCFVSLAGQTMGMDNLELIFVNDASTDEGATWAMLSELEHAYPESIMIIDLPQNRRQGGARNEALKYASGEYVAFVDADDWINDNMCEKAYAAAKQYDADMVQFNHLLYFEGKGTIENPLKMKDEVLTIHHADERKRMLMAEKLTYGCWNKLYRRSMIEEAGVEFAEHCIYEEPLFVYPLLFYVNRAVIRSDYLYVYRQNHSGTMRNDMKDRQTLTQHANVQLAVWDYMKMTPFMEEYGEEIKAYFLHTYLYEYLDFAKHRDMKINWDDYRKLAENALKEVQPLKLNRYQDIFVKQSVLYEIIRDGMDTARLERFYEDM